MLDICLELRSSELLISNQFSLCMKGGGGGRKAYRTSPTRDFMIYSHGLISGETPILYLNSTD